MNPQRPQKSSLIGCASQHPAVPFFSPARDAFVPHELPTGTRFISMPRHPDFLRGLRHHHSRKDWLCPYAEPGTSVRWMLCFTEDHAAGEQRNVVSSNPLTREMVSTPV
jgi:hypothetical protein